MTNATLRREGNLRFASVESTGYPAEPQDLHAQVLQRLSTQPVDPYGPLTIWFDHPPADEGPDRWPCRVGTAITGLARPDAELLVEDYRDLTVLALPFMDPIADLGLAHMELSRQAGTTGKRLRPYWRLCLTRQQLSDGNLLPMPEIAVFVDDG